MTFEIQKAIKYNFVQLQNDRVNGGGGGFQSEKEFDLPLSPSTSVSARTLKKTRPVC